MAIINQATKELQVKIVYYGPGKGGKTTNLEQVHANVPKRAGKGQAGLTRDQLRPHAVLRFFCQLKRWLSRFQNQISTLLPFRAR